jgi:nicotinamide-nucleotide amidase
VQIEIINTGTELLLGCILNTHQQWLCRKLSDLGYLIARQVTVPDTGPAIQEAVREALERADLILVTGGLGPTSDDRTRDFIATLLGRKLVHNQTVMDDINGFFARRHRATPAHTEVQALVPEGALVLRNRCGTAPGLAITIDAGKFKPGESWLIMLPGPPNELHPMFDEQVAPLLKSHLPLREPFLSLTLNTTGLGESVVENKIASPLKTLVDAGLEIGYCARPSEVDVRLSARGAHAKQLISQAEQIVRGLVGEYIFGASNQELPSVIIGLLARKHKTLAVAESCTGGNLAHRLTNVPGASAVFLGGWITYQNAAKEKFLGVQAKTLAEHGAVSEPTAREMALGARTRMCADYALSITGIAGPGGGSGAKPVGTVFIGLATPDRVDVVQRFNPLDRETFKYVTTQQALELLRRELLG